MKGYFLILALMATSWMLSAGSSLASIQQSETILTTKLDNALFLDGVIIIYQGLHDTALDISSVGTAVGTLLDSTGKVAWTDQFETLKTITFEHSAYSRGTYEFILEKHDGTFLESVSFEMK